MSSCNAHIRNFCFVKYPHRRSSCISATLTCLASSWYAEITNSPTPACDQRQPQYIYIYIYIHIYIYVYIYIYIYIKNMQNRLINNSSNYSLFSLQAGLSSRTKTKSRMTKNTYRVAHKMWTISFRCLQRVYHTLKYFYNILQYIKH